MQDNIAKGIHHIFYYFNRFMKMLDFPQLPTVFFGFILSLMPDLKKKNQRIKY